MAVRGLGLTLPHHNSRDDITGAIPMMIRLFAAAFLTLAFAASSTLAADPAKPVTALSAYPTALKLKGMDDAPQIILTGKRADGREVDLSASATYSVSDPSVARIEANGRVFPLANGTAEITATVSGMSVK